jgi:hypothetical protein
MIDRNFLNLPIPNLLVAFVTIPNLKIVSQLFINQYLTYPIFQGQIICKKEIFSSLGS